MKPFLAILCAAASACCFAQPATDLGESRFNSIKPQVTVVVQKGPTTSADIVEITMLEEQYPADLLNAQVQKMCAELGSLPRGLVIAKQEKMTAVGTKVTFLKAKFATDHIIGPGATTLRIQPILRAFAGAPAPHTIEGFMIGFEGIPPVAGRTIQSYTLPGVLESAARSVPPQQVDDPIKPFTIPAVTEYRIHLLTQDADKIVYPDSMADIPKPPDPPVVPKPQNRTWILVLSIVSGVALAALVYLALLRAGRRTAGNRLPKI